MLKKQSIIQSLFILFIGVLMGCSLVGGNAPAEEIEEGRKVTKLSQSEEEDMLLLFSKVYEVIKSDYVEEVGEKELLEAAMNGMLSSLDPHSQFLNAEEFKEMNEDTRGEFGGLGMTVSKGKMGILVIAPMDDTPAFRAGVQSGDIITHVDDVIVSELSLSDSVKKLKGKPGSKVKLTIFREGENKPLKMTLKREMIHVQSVKTELKRDGKIGYIRISVFDTNTDTLLKKGIAKLQKDSKQIEGYILDVRANGGGLLPQAIAVVDTFIEGGEVVSTRPRDKEQGKSYFAEHGPYAVKGDLTNGLPLVVLINQGSASASEIVAGALQDHKRAVIAGVKSYGKGSVQTLMPVTEDTAIKLTTSRYYLPSGRTIQAKGITPDVEIKFAKVEEIENEDSDLFSEANRANALDAKKTQKKSEKEDKDKKDDYQLERAMDLLRGMAVYHDSQPKTVEKINETTSESEDKEEKK
ncbi:MAG: S41 family peptidase [Alphaproteobacteria bacterium]|nr:S41 family peptidase [Alphaproteobacteria bacterium]